jgi:hypothetical protein
MLQFFLAATKRSGSVVGLTQSLKDCSSIFIEPAALSGRHSTSDILKLSSSSTVIEEEA